MGYLRKHWRGELSLALSFWVNFVLLNIFFSTIAVLNSDCHFTDNPVVISRIGIILIVIQLVFVFPWQFIGLWRSGTNRFKRCGRHFWSVAVKLLIVLVLLSHIGRTIYLWSFYQDTFKIAFLKDDVTECTMSLMVDNTVLRLEGGLPFGVSDEFTKTLEKHPEVETIILDCRGGRLYEARKMADYIIQRKLDTSTVKGCYSAGNILFAAGENRYLCKNAWLGFHEYYYPEPFRDYVDIQSEYRKDWGFYQLRGVSRDFQEKMFGAEPNDYWYPSQQELLDGGMIHAVVDLMEILPPEDAILYGYDTTRSSSKEAKTDKVTTDQVKGWILACSSVLWERNRDDFVTLAGREINKNAIQSEKKLLSEWWGIESRQELLNDLLWLTQEGGHRNDFDRDGQWTSMMTPEKLEEYLKPYEQYTEKCNELRIAQQYSEQLGDKSIMGWDLSRYMCLCRWGYLCGWLSEKETWELMIPVARELQQTFDSWEELGQNYLIGRQYWSYKQTREGGQLYEEALQRLTEMPSSPWNQYAWDMDLGDAYELVVDTLPSEDKSPSQTSKPTKPQTVPGFDTIPQIEIDVVELSEPAGAVALMPFRFPADGAENVNPDMHLVLTFSEPPVLGNSGQVRIYDAADDRLVDTLDMSIPPGPTIGDKTKVPYTAVPYEYVSGHFTNANTKPGHAVGYGVAYVGHLSAYDYRGGY